MSRIRADRLVDRAGTSAPLLPHGAVVTGVATATSFSGSGSGLTNIPAGQLTGTISGDITGNAAGLSGTPDINVRNVVGVAATYTGNLNVGGVLTYEDVSNVDSVGIVTAQGGVIASGIGLTVAAGGTKLDGYKVENGKMGGSTSLNGEFDFFLEDGHVHRYNAATGGDYWPDFKVSSTKSLHSVMPNVGDTVTTTLIVASSSHYLNNPSGLRFKIDNNETNIDTVYVGGSAPAAPNGSGWDIYHFTIIMLNPDLSFGTPSYAVIINALGAS